MDKSDIKIIPFQKATAEHYHLMLMADPSKTIVKSYLPRSYKFELVADAKLLGLVLLIDTRPETIEIVNLAVAEEFQNSGYGEKLVHFALHWAQKNHYHTVEIGTGSTSFAQLYLYQKCGFRVVSIDRDFFVDNYHEPIIENKLVLKDMIRLKKQL
ncbi:putative N-acetyltransferase YvbK [Companilactobacillus crustorum]|uniref:Acetyltransferase n=3 Tax=Companilactobacillus TaxID=2767879 RepID=A0A837RK05_9LACO|nr:GNAT family N-acetyltransferase [Companilactobacillus crustorum]KRK44489.1 acetyltransferase [Companilactobacillus crustorum JCM 15951]KRO21860.1 acetyltransferase [Companilactobacillus crustorum]WDT65765.1 GNAT family N-acetyltransferase [Companilactobacillus crustorum]GEO77448.1 putative N-acetyltransferase YvbK [Companilactobacillus crustorum]